MKFRVVAFAILAPTLAACGQAATTGDGGNSPAEFAQLSRENEQAEEMSENSNQSAKPAARPSAKSDKKLQSTPGMNKAVKPSPLVAPAEIDPVPPPVEGTEPLNGN